MSVETMPYIRGLERMVRAAGRRVAEADEPELAELVRLRDVVDESIRSAVDGWRRMGRSWSEVGRALGITKQAAAQRFGHEEQEQ